MLQSPPSRRRGLKYNLANQSTMRNAVASFSEAWIEIYTSDGVSVTDLSRLLLGGVD